MLKLQILNHQLYQRSLEGTPVSEKELHCIKVDIPRNIPVKGQINELQQDIINPEDFVQPPLTHRSEDNGNSLYRHLLLLPWVATENCRSLVSCCKEDKFTSFQTNEGNIFYLIGLRATEQVRISILASIRHSRGRLVDENNSKSRTRDRSLEIVCIKNAKTTSSKSPAIPGKSDTACGSTSLFKGPEGTQISEKELHCIKVDIHRNIPVKGQISELQRDIINPEDVIIIRRSVGEGSKPIFEREEIKSTSKKVGEIEERRTVIAVESGDSGQNHLEDALHPLIRYDTVINVLHLIDDPTLLMLHKDWQKRHMNNDIG
uniref:Complementary sex determination N-terminal domain-containing protein n=1 Tax=Vespula pensylvanica TaxID=30213 RepID=A0A834JL15_VESPE|nr:hypothetical protein H0235_017618 [Vespula pensylvanica]